MSPPVETVLSLPGAHPCLLFFHHLAGADRPLFHLINGSWTHPLLDRAMPTLSTSGNLGVVWMALLGAMAAFGKKTGRRIALAGLVAFAIGFAASVLIKEATARPRPFAVLPHARLLVPEPGSFAFPSGHTTSAFAAASGAVLAARKLLGRVPPWGWGMLALAAAISYSRVYVGAHWPTDVAAGVVLGLTSGWVGARLVGGPKNLAAAAAHVGRAGGGEVRPSGRRSAFPSPKDRPAGFPSVRHPDRGGGAESALRRLQIVGTREAGGTTCPTSPKAPQAAPSRVAPPGTRCLLPVVAAGAQAAGTRLRKRVRERLPAHARPRSREGAFAVPRADAASLAVLRGQPAGAKRTPASSGAGSEEEVVR